MKRWIALALAIGAVCLIVFVFSRRREAAARGVERAASELSTAELERLREDVARLKAQPPTREVHYLSPDAAASVPASESATVTADPRVEEERLREAQRRAVVDLDVRIASEAVDSQWSLAMNRQVRDVLQQHVPSAKLVDTECGTSLCRVVVSHDSLDAQRQIGHDLRGLEPFRTGVYYDYDKTSNPPKTSLYVVRWKGTPSRALRAIAESARRRYRMK